MATTVKTGWLRDKNGDKFAPKTLTSQVQTSDGTLFEDKLQTDLDTTLTTAQAYTDTKTVTLESLIDSLQTVVDSKANSVHIHAISDVTNLQTTLDAKVPDSRTINGMALSANITLSASDVGADASGSADEALVSAKEYTDTEVTAIKNIWYGTCTTAAATASKVVTTITGDFTLKEGATVYVLFNTAHTSTSRITLNVDGTGDTAVNLSSTNGMTAYQIAAKQVICFVYDGGSFRVQGGSLATTTYYGLTKLSSSTSSTSTTMAATPSAVKEAYDLAAASLPVAGGTMTGTLILAADPTNDLEAATKQYVDNAITTAITNAIAASY